MSGFKDLFSGHAVDYARYRPVYPRALYQWLSDHCSDHSRVWDCATGNGQAALALADHFNQVIATDASAQQIDSATPHPNVDYRVATAENSGLEDHSVGLVTVAQALHWFNLEVFYLEVKRVLKPGGLLAVWTYELTTVNADVDRVVWKLYEDILGEYWSPHRVLVEQGYQTLPFPFEELQTPDFMIEHQWSLQDLMGYLYTWSAAKKYEQTHGKNPLNLVTDELTEAWQASLSDNAESTLSVRWPIKIRAGRV